MAQRTEILTPREVEQGLTDKPGRLIVYGGSMFSGKTEKALKYHERFENWHIPHQVFKHSIDGRYEGVDRINSHNGNGADCEPFVDPYELYTNVNEETRAIIIDEGQFFLNLTEKDNPPEPSLIGPHQDRLLEVVDQLLSEGVHVIVTGLDTDFANRGFGAIPQLLEEAHISHLLHGECHVCREPSSYTQRLINNEPAKLSDPLIMVGGNEAYETRCETHYQAPQ